MKLKYFVVGMTPFLGMYLYFLIKLVYSSIRLFGLAGVSLIGIGIFSLVAVTLLFLFHNSSILKMVMGVINEIWMVLLILISIIHVFQYFYLLFSTSIWNGVFGVFLIRDAVKDWQEGSRNEKLDFKEKRTKIIAIVLSSVVVFSAFLTISPFFNNKTYTFEVSDTQAQNYELVLYLPATNETVDVCRDANATLSFNAVQDVFNGSNPSGAVLANVVKYANSQGVPIEIWPLFNRSSGFHYISARNTEALWGLYNDVHNWTEYYNITLDYLLWDIEDWVYGEDMGYEGWAKNIPVLNSLGNLSMYGVILNDNLDAWDDIIAEWKAMAIQSQADGHIMRGTVNPSAYDYADGDLDFSTLNFMPSLELIPEFQYISSMYYTGCEWGLAWGGAGPELVYQNTKMMTKVNPGPIAVCLGCINYVQYQNISAVKNDVMLALAAGANAVRLFQGGSWVYGWIGPVHGYSGLNDLLQACRTGGEAHYTHTGTYDISFMGSTIGDIIIDFFKW